MSRNADGSAEVTLRVDRIEAGWRSWTNEKSLWHRVCLHFAFVEEPCPAPYRAAVIAWRRQPQGIPNEPTIILSPRGGGRGNSRQGRRWCRVARADRDSQVSALGVGLRSGAPFRCTHRIAHRKRGPLSTRTLRCTLPFQLSMALVALLALVALFLPTATLASRNDARHLCA